MKCIRGAHNLKIGSTSKRKVKVNGGIWISPLVPTHQTTNAHELTQFIYCPVKTIYSCHGLKKDMIFFNWVDMKHTEANVLYALLLIERGLSKVDSLCVFGPYTSKYVPVFLS